MNLYINRKVAPLIFLLLIFIVLLVGCTTPGSETINHAPIITSTPITSATVNQVYTYNVVAIDPDGDTLIYSLTVSHTGMTINSWTGEINWTPISAGDYDVTVEVFDNGSPVKSVSQSFTIHVEEAPSVNQPPIITSTPITSATVNQTYTYNVDATDPDGDTLTYSLTTKPTGMTINSTTGLINWTPTSTGNYDVTVRVSDESLFDTQSFTITVEDGEVTPLTVVTNNASNIGDTTATANGNITATGGENCTVRGFQYGLSKTPTWDVHSSGSFGTGSFSMELSGLTLCTKYYVRAYAVNSAGTSYGVWKSFTTTGCILTPNLKLTPSSQTVTVGSQATINVVVEDVTDLRGANVTLNFDANKLQYSSSDDGDFIPNDFLAPATVDNVRGAVTLDIAGLGASGYHSGMGTGTIITVKFDTLSTGKTNITFGATTLRDKSNNPITHTKGSGCSVNIN